MTAVSVVTKTLRALIRKQWLKLYSISQRFNVILIEFMQDSLRFRRHISSILQLLDNNIFNVYHK